MGIIIKSLISAALIAHMFNLKKIRAMDQVNKNICLLTLPEIAAWQVVSSEAKPNIAVVAELPALQRGAVWKVRQIEDLWDSILRNFPIGAFIISLRNDGDEFGAQPFKHQKGMMNNPTHLLLDGQQRATGIALGFLDPWRDSPKFNDIKSVLWIDLARPPSSRDVDFVLRVVTRAHPWGYLRSDPTSRISEHQMRLGLRAFKQASHPAYDTARPSEIPLASVWPWDAEAPIPLVLLIESLVYTRGEIGSAKKLVWQRIQELPFMSVAKNLESKRDLPAEITHWQSQQENITNAFIEGSSYWSLRLEEILTLLYRRISDFVIPIITVPLSKLETSRDEREKSAIETLFIRINSSGTPLEGEELIYSLIKSSWVEAPSSIERLTHRLATPARTALLASRLVRARHQMASNSLSASRLKLTPTPTVDEFRRLMRGLNTEHKGFFKELKCFISRDGLGIFESAYEFLTTGGFALPPVLASELAQRSPDVFFLFLRWLDKLHEAGANPMKLGNRVRSRVIGFLTALAWFSSPDGKPKAVDSVWDDLQRCKATDLSVFFGRTKFVKTCRLDDRGNLHMVPIIPPEVLELALKTRILGYVGCSDTIKAADSAIWKEWSRWRWLVDEKRPKQIDVTLKPIFQAAEEHIRDGETVSDRVRESWGRFIDSLWGNRSMLIYAQRDWIIKWFPDFDPSLPEFLEDKNRPWDYDHIHPQSLLQGRNGGSLRGMPQLIKELNNSIGNLRAWPLEANRSDGNSAPAIKLDQVSEEEYRYNVENGADGRAASFINEDHWELYWKYCVPGQGNLAQQSNHKEREALVNAIVRRFIAIYSEWYTTLKLSTLTNATVRGA